MIVPLSKIERNVTFRKLRVIFKIKKEKRNLRSNFVFYAIILSSSREVTTQENKITSLCE